MPFDIGDRIDVDTEDGLEPAFVIGPPESGLSSEMRVRFDDGVTDDWEVEDFRAPCAATRASAEAAVASVAQAAATAAPTSAPADGILESMEDDELDVLYDRTCGVVSAIDENGDGAVDADELTHFFEQLHSISGSDEQNPPRDEAELIIEGVGNGSEVGLEALTELLMETFAVDMHMLDDIEELLYKKRAGEAGDLEAQMAAKFQARPEEGTPNPSSTISSSSGSQRAGAGAAESASELLSSCVEASNRASATVLTQQEATEVQVREFYMRLRLICKRRRRRLLREVNDTAEARQLKLIDRGDEIQKTLRSAEAILEVPPEEIEEDETLSEELITLASTSFLLLLLLLSSVSPSRPWSNNVAVIGSNSLTLICPLSQFACKCVERSNLLAGRRRYRPFGRLVEGDGLDCPL